MSNLTILGDTSGSVVLQAPAVAGSTTITLAAQSGTLNVGGPSFNTYAGSNQTPSNGVYTKVNFDTEVWDTNSCYDTTNKRFVPNVAGYYQFNITLAFNPVPSSELVVALYKNGSAIQYLSYTAGVVSLYRITCSGMAQANGSTDYFEAYMYQTNGAVLSGGITGTAFSGFLARTA